MDFRTYSVFAAAALSFSLSSCLEEEGEVIVHLEDKLDGQAYDLDRVREYIGAEEAKLARFEEAAANQIEIEKLTAILVEVQKVQKAAEAENMELSDQISLTNLELSQYQDQHYAQIRRQSVGKNIDLSETKGDAFKAARILSITPLSLRVVISSGPQSVPLAELPSSVRERLGMSEKHAEVIRAKRAANALARSEKWAEWKATQGKRDKENAMTEIENEIKEKRVEIDALKEAINLRMQQMTAWKSKASGFETRAFETQQRGKSSKSWLKRSDLARDKAEELADLNRHDWTIVARLKAQTAELKKMGGF